MEDIRDEKAMEDLTAEEMSGKETAQEPEDQAVKKRKTRQVSRRMIWDFSGRRKRIKKMNRSLS